MEKGLLKNSVALPLLFAFTLLLAGFYLSGQVGFNMEEKMMIEKYKMANSIYEDGKKLYVKGKVEKAEKKFKQCLEKMPEFADASYFMAQILSQRGELQPALQAIEKAKTDFAVIAKLYTFMHQQRLEMLREEITRLREVMENFEKKLTTAGPDERRNVQSQIGITKARIDQLNTGLNEQPIAATMNTPADYFYVHGNVLFKLKRFADAILQYTEAIRIDPKHGFAYNNLINLLFMARNYPEAVKYLKQAETYNIQVNPKLKEAVEKAAGI